MMNGKKAFVFYILYSLILLFSIQSTSKAAGETIKVGYFSYDGYQEKDNNGNYSGYGYEYLQEISKYTGWKYEYIEGTWDECLQRLKSGEIDLLTLAQYTSNRAKIFDYSSISMGSLYMTLSVRADNNTYTENDFHSFDGMRVGVLKNDATYVRFARTCSNYNIQVKTFDYNNMNDLENDLQEGKVDAILSNNMRKTHNEKIIAQLSPIDFYAAVKKGDYVTLSELNNAMEEIKINTPNLSSDLYEKYYSRNNNNALLLLGTEKDYLKELGTIRAALVLTGPPLSYCEDGKYKGIICDIMELVSNDLHTKISYVPANTYDDAIALVKNGKADMVCNFPMDYNLADKYNIKLTSSYLNFGYCAVSKSLKDIDSLRVALNLNDKIDIKNLSENSKDYIISFYDNEEECLNSVKSGKQDITYLNTYSADYYLDKDKFHNLEASYLPNYRNDICISVNDTKDTTLQILLNKEMNHLSKDAVNSVIIKSTLFTKNKVSFLSFIYDNPILVVVCVSIISTVIIGILLALFYMKRRYQDHIYQLAYIDRETGLWNINKFEEEAGKTIRENNKNKYAVISFDVNRFSIINDRYSREVGDYIIIKISDTLKMVVQDTMVVARVKADHFIMLVPFMEQPEIVTLTQDINNKLSSYESNGTQIKLHMNFGVYLIEDSNQVITRAIDFAETARRECGINMTHIAFYDDNMKQNLLREKDIEDAMESALERGEFTVFYQPKYDMKNNRVIGAEALIRWISPEKGFLSPDSFIPIFEKNGFVVEIDFFVLEEVCKLVNSYKERGLELFPISVNQSRVHLDQKDYIDRLKALVDKYHISPNAIELEITETVFDNYKNALEAVISMKSLGFSVSVDDFGSGYSSLNLLSSIPLDILKIDRDFLSTLQTSKKAQVILKKVVELAKELHMEVICEGVEKQEQIDFLLSVGCQYAQGYFFSKPVPLDEFEKKIITDREIIEDLSYEK